MTTTENIAEAVRYPTRIESSPGMELIEQGRRLRASLKVAEKWIKATSAESGEPGEMWHQARYTYDRLEEELSRVPHEIEVAERAREFAKAERPAPEGVARSATLSNTQRPNEGD